LAEKKREEATCSFHSFVREKRIDDNNNEQIPFTADDFASFCDHLMSQPEVDLRDEQTRNRIKTSLYAPVEHCEIIDDRTIFGRFRAPYTGHSYENTDVGEVPESSVSLRPFFFIAYFAEDGKIYVGSQYLGTFGGWGKLERTLRSFFPKDYRVVSYAYRHSASSYAGAKPKEVRVNFSRRPKEITGKAAFGQRGAMTFKQMSNEDSTFKITVTESILANIGKPTAVIKKAVSDMLSDNEMLSLRQEDIEDCTVVATVDGKTTTINVIESGHFATRFPLGIVDYIKGHPDKNKAKAAMAALLDSQIISRSERV